MADLKSDVVGRVNRLALRPSEKNALLPLMEAISNSVHSVTDRFGPETHQLGQITIQVIREDVSSEERRVIGFDIEDNGVGFTNENYQSFQTPDSRLKEKKGGKGVGRLAWLKVFEGIEVDSVYMENSNPKSRCFYFVLAEKNQIRERENATESQVQRTTVKFRNFKPEYNVHCPLKRGVLEERIAAHFIPLFLTGNAPKIVVVDDLKTDVQDLFSENIVEEQTEEVTVNFGEEVSLKVWSLKCRRAMRFNSQAYHYSFIAGDSRSVVDYPMDDQLGLRWIDGELIYIACTSSPFLDSKVNSERTAFTLDADELVEIKRVIASSAKRFLEKEISVLVEEKVSTAKEVISENPEFIYILPEIKKFAEALQANANKKEEIFIELSRNRFRRHK